jgi:DNA (cytosine-5)-methyltransferase 1
VGRIGCVLASRERDQELELPDGELVESLRSTTRPDFELARQAVRIVDLFAGCGGLTLGIAEAARRHGLGLDVPLALDFDEDAARVYAANFPKAQVVHAPVEEFFDGRLGDDRLTPREADVRAQVRGDGPVHVLVGGPPCQGHSNLNNHTRRADPRNGLYSRMARAAEVLEPWAVIIENVQSVTRDRSGVVQVTADSLQEAGYDVCDGVVDLAQLGVPQRRRRHVLVATLPPFPVAASIVDKVVATRSPRRDLAWAIRDLSDAEGTTPFGSASKMSPENASRIAWLLDNAAYDLPNELRPPCHRDDHSYTAMYGRLRWTEPTQTITSGFTCMGQGRYVHPSRPRTLTPHEAARIQHFPDWFDFTAGGLVTRRRSWTQMIGNAVPPRLSSALLDQLLVRNVLR